MTSSKVHTTRDSFLHSYIRGEAAFGFWGLISKGLAGVSALIIISQLDIYRYGLYVLIFAFYYLVVGFMLRPLSNVVFNDIIRFNSEGKKAEAKKLFLENVVVRFTSALVTFGAVFWGSELIAYFYEQDMASLFRIISFMFLIDVWTTSMRTLFQVHLRFSALVLRQVLYRFLKLVLILVFIIIFPFSIREALFAHVFASFLAALSFLPSSIRLSRPWWLVTASRKPILFNIVKAYGKWALFGEIATAATNNIRPWLIRFFINTEAVAIYAVAEGIFGAVKTAIPVSTLETLIPREVKDRERRGRLLLRGTKYLIVVGTFLGVCSAFIVPPLILWLFPHYESSVSLFLILLLALPVLSFRILGTQFVVALRKQKFIFFTQILKIVLGILGPVTLLYYFGIWGMAIERILVVIIIGAIYFGYLVRNEVDVRDWKELFYFTKEDVKFVRNMWNIFIAQIRTSIFKYMPRI